MDIIRASLFSFLLSLCYITVLASEGLQPEFDSQTEKTRYLEYRAKNILQCNITGISPTAASDYSIKWLKEDQLMEPSKESPPHYEFKQVNLYNTLTIYKTREEDVAKYTCVLKRNDNLRSNIVRADIFTVGIPTAKIVSQGTFIEGQKITLECVVSGHPPPTIQWRFGNQTFAVSDGRITLSPNANRLPNAILQIDEAKMSDRGEYTCSAHNPANLYLNISTEAEAFVRVKDKLAALWPFIGICAEVVVLCAIIFIYERKRNKAELDESDTDQSPEQKNTPDHGKESVRQRK